MSVSAKFGTCTVVSVNGTPIEAKMWTFTLECAHVIFNKFPITTHDGASAKFSTSSDEMDYSVCKRAWCYGKMEDSQTKVLHIGDPDVYDRMTEDQQLQAI